MPLPRQCNLLVSSKMLISSSLDYSITFSAQAEYHPVQGPQESNWRASNVGYAGTVLTVISLRGRIYRNELKTPSSDAKLETKKRPLQTFLRSRNPCQRSPQYPISPLHLRMSLASLLQLLPYLPSS